MESEKDFIQEEKKIRSKEDFDIAIKACVSILGVMSVPYQLPIEIIDSVRKEAEHKFNFKELSSAILSPLVTEYRDVVDGVFHAPKKVHEVHIKAAKYINEIHGYYHDESLSSDEFTSKVRKLSEEVKEKTKKESQILTKDIAKAGISVVTTMAGDTHIESQLIQLEQNIVAKAASDANRVRFGLVNFNNRYKNQNKKIASSPENNI